MTYRKVGGLHFIGFAHVGVVLYSRSGPCFSHRLCNRLRHRVQNCMAALRLWWLTQAPEYARMFIP